MIRTEALPDPFFSLLLNTRTKKEKSENWRVKNRSGSASVLIRTFIDIVLVNIWHLERIHIKCVLMAISINFKVIFSKAKVAQSCLTLCKPMGFSRPEYWSGESFPSPADLSNPGIELWPPALQADSLPAEPQWKPKNTGVGSLSLLQQIFPTQESNQGLLHCRWILYQMSYQGSPDILNQDVSLEI